MRHAEQLLAMRRSGVKPAHVRLTDQPEERGSAWWQWAELQPFADIVVEPGDSAPVADLRCLVGLPVLVDIPNPERCMRWAEAAKAAGARPVIALYPTPEVV